MVSPLINSPPLLDPVANLVEAPLIAHAPLTRTVLDSQLDSYAYRRGLLDRFDVLRPAYVAAYQNGATYQPINKVGVLEGTFFAEAETVPNIRDLMFLVPYQEQFLAYLPRKHVVSVRLWQNPLMPTAADFSRKSFFKFLIPYREGVISDSNLSPTERMIWGSRLVEGLALGYKVRLVDQYQQTSVAVKDEDDLVEAMAVKTGQNSTINNRQRYRWLMYRQP